MVQIWTAPLGRLQHYSNITPDPEVTSRPPSVDAAETMHPHCNLLGLGCNVFKCKIWMQKLIRIPTPPKSGGPPKIYKKMFWELFTIPVSKIKCVKMLFTFCSREKLFAFQCKCTSSVDWFIIEKNIFIIRLIYYSMQFYRQRVPGLFDYIFQQKKRKKGSIQKFIDTFDLEIMFLIIKCLAQKMSTLPK